MHCVTASKLQYSIVLSIIYTRTQHLHNNVPASILVFQWQLAITLDTVFATHSAAHSVHSGPGMGGRDQTSQTPRPEGEERGEGRGRVGWGGKGRGETEPEAIHQSGEYLEKFRFYF